MCCGQISAQQHNQQHLEKLNYAYTYLRNNYVDDVDLEPLVEAALEATFKELDPHSSYLSREEFMAMYSGINGEYSGVGFSMTTLRDTLIVTRILEGSPSERAGVKKNDRLISVNGSSLIGIEHERAVELLRGKKGSVATLSIIRGGEPISIDVVRDDIATRAIGDSFMLNDSVAYVRVDSFLSKTTTEEFISAMNSLQDVKSLILDLRGNIGGLLPSAVQFSELFLKRGDVIVSLEGRKSSTTYQASKNGNYADMPVVVLIDEDTASASEIVAGALQDHDRAVIVGRRSYGKGLVQKLIKFKDESGMRITTSRYRTPSGRIIQRPNNNGELEEYLNDRERYSPLDTTSIPDSLVYTTLNTARKVYGGGGIMPDIYIAMDSTSHTPFTRAVIEQNVVQIAIIDIFDRTPIDDFKTVYPTAEELMKNYTLDNFTVSLLTSQVCESSECVADDKSLEECRAIIAAQIAEEAYMSGFYYRLYGRYHDIALIRAMEIIGDKLFQKRILSPITPQNE